MNEEYERKRAACPVRHVDSREFRLAAKSAGWHDRTIDLYLKPPILKERTVLVGDESLILR